MEKTWRHEVMKAVVLRLPLLANGNGLWLWLPTKEEEEQQQCVPNHVEKKRRFSKKKQAGIIIGSAVLGMIIIGLVTYIWKKKLRNQVQPSAIISAMTKGNIGKECDNVGRKEDIELPIFDLTAIANATDNFSNNKKLGEGGFGSVYKNNGQLVLVKVVNTIREVALV
ncbi:receptor-like serine/threonine-protein kinase sd1-8 [Quercus suber]|uniref:Receptor-like serine/threonine-protein kinase sd1-8 n=1 Tax=Quercus suber TaxID=58331 RepID=A0AAW0K587_QUESU